MARYNVWQNRSAYAAAETLSDEERRTNRGAYFGSVHITLAHILWGDRVWMSRFAGTPPVRTDSNQGASVYYDNWQTLCEERVAFDAVIQAWADGLSEAWLAADFTWSNIAGTRTTTQPAWWLVAHMFNHQTHHRGQAHALLTSFGAVPEDTDMFFLPPQ